MKTINMGDKVELTALQLVYLLDDAMETLCLRAEDGQEVDTMVIAKEKVLELFERRKERGDVNATRVAAERLAAQAGALKDLLELRITK